MSTEIQVNAPVQLRRMTLAEATASTEVLLDGQALVVDRNRIYHGDNATMISGLVAAGVYSMSSTEVQAEVDALAALIDGTLKAPEFFQAAGTYPVTFDGGAVQRGDTFRLGAGTMGAISVNAEDLLVALVDTPGQTDANWQTIESNRVVVDQAGIENSSTTDNTSLVSPLRWWQGFAKGLTLSPFLAAVRGTVLTGLSLVSSAAVTAADTILVAVGKLQKQINDHLADTANPHEVTAEQLALDVLVINDQTGTSYTLDLTDADVNAYLRLSNAAAITVTIPLHSAVAFSTGNQINGVIGAAGAATFSFAGGITVNAIDDNYTTGGKGSAFALIYRGSDVWDLFLGSTPVVASDDITDASTAGKDWLTAADVAVQKALIGFGTEAFSGHVVSVSNGTITLEFYAAYAFTIVDLHIITGAGSITAAIKINGTDVTSMSAVSVTTTVAAATASGANSVAIGNKVTMVLSSNSGASDLQWTLKTAR